MQKQFTKAYYAYKLSDEPPIQQNGVGRPTFIGHPITNDTRI